MMMKAMYQSHRIPREDLALVNGVASDALSLWEGQLQSYIMEVEPSSRVECATTSGLDDSGDADLYLRMNQYVDISRGLYDCSSESESTSLESCRTYAAASSTVVVSLHAWKSFEDVSLMCTGVVVDAPLTLNYEEPSAPFSLAVDEYVSFLIAPPSIGIGGTAMCQTTGLNGDADLLLRWNAEPSASTADCISNFEESEETCAAEIPDNEAVLWVQVVAYAAFTDLVVECFVTATLPVVRLAAGVPSDPVTLNAQQVQKHFLSIQSEARVSCEVSASAGTGVMSLNWQEAVSGYGLNLSGVCQTAFDSPCEVVDQGFYSVLWVTVRADTAVQGMSVTCTSAFAQAPILLNGVPSNPISLTEAQTKVYQFEVSRGINTTCVTTAVGGDLDLYVRFSTPPDLLNAVLDCVSDTASSDEICTVFDAEGAITLWVTLRAFDGPVEGATVTCTILTAMLVGNDPIELALFEVSSALSLDTGDVQSFTLTVPSSTNTRVVCNLVGDNGDADLYFRYGEEADFINVVPDCVSELVGSAEVCSVRNRGGSTVAWATVYAFEGVSLGACTAMNHFRNVSYRFAFFLVY
jgi:hypothetical protein